MAIREVKLRNNFEIFDRKLHNLGISLNDLQKQQFAAYYEMMVEKNKVMNLTSITEPLDVIDKHFVDSLAVFNAVCELSAKDQDIREKLDFNNNLSVLTASDVFFCNSDNSL